MHISRFFSTCAVMATLLAVGCGEITNKENIVIARMDGETITRGVLQKHIRDMAEEDRPIIQYQTDVLRVLEDYIDQNILAERARRLREEGKIKPDRERATALYFQENPEKRMAFAIADPEAAGFTEGQVAALRNEVEFAIDDVEERIMREEALAYNAADLLRAGLLRITEDDLRREYEFRKSELQTFEVVDFMGIRIPMQAPDSRRAAAQIFDRIVSGETTFDAEIDSYVARDPRFGMRSMMENDPANVRFQPFWLEVSGAENGDVIGPVPLPEYQQVGADGNAAVQPAAWVVLKVVNIVPPREKSLEEAQQELAEPLLRRRTMQMLRDEHGVEIYEDKLWNPAGYGDQFEGQFIETGRPRSDR